VLYTIATTLYNLIGKWSHKNTVSLLNNVNKIKTKRGVIRHQYPDIHPAWNQRSSRHLHHLGGTKETTWYEIGPWHFYNHVIFKFTSCSDSRLMLACTEWPFRMKFTQEIGSIGCNCMSSLYFHSWQEINIFLNWTGRRESWKQQYFHVACVTIDGVWIGEWIYWPLIYTTRNYKQLQRHRYSPQFTNHHSTR
jgi:hypothetical protein